jgi:urease accessory protein UreE
MIHQACCLETMVHPAMASSEPADGPLVLRERGLAASPGAVPALVLALSAAERTQLRGLRCTACGRQVLLQLPRGAALEPGEWLAATAAEPLVQVRAAAEELR